MLSPVFRKGPKSGLLVLVLGFCLLRGLSGPVDLLISILIPSVETSEFSFAEAVLVLTAFGCFFAVLRKRRSAITWALFALLADLLSLGPVNLLERPVLFVPGLLWGAVIWAIPRLVPRPPVVESRWRDLRIGILATIGFFMALEVLAGWLIGSRFQRILDPPDPVIQPAIEPVAGVPTLATIGSSPANVERIHDRPFSRILAERFRGRMNFLFYREGGLPSHRLVRIVRDLLRSEKKPDALILYVGHQDYNAARGVAFLQDMDLVGDDERTLSALQWLIRRSSLVRLSLYLLWENRYGHLANNTTEWREAVFRQYAENMDRIVTEAGEHGVHVFAVTVQADRARIIEASRAYMEMENRYIRELPARFRHVTLVDFEPVLDAMYPNGPKPDCEPFEPDPILGGCGDPYHLGPRGHEVLADLLGPVLERFVATRGTAPAP